MTPALAAGAAAAPDATPRERVSDEPLRILLAIPFYPPVVGGAEMHVSRLAAALARRGHHVHVITTYAPPMQRTRRWRDPNGIAVTSVAHSLPVALRPRAFVFEVAKRIALAIPRYDMVELFLPGLHLPAGLMAARWRGTGSAVMFGGNHEVPRLTTLRRGRWQLAALRQWADRVVVLNEEMRRDVIATGVPVERTTWLPCSVDTSSFSPPDASARRALRERLHLPDDAFVVAFVGRLVPAKNLPALLHGVARYARAGRPIVMCLVGDGPERPALEAIAGEAPAGTVRFLGARQGQDVADVLRASDVFAMLSHSEGIPCALIEAMAVGLPSIVHDIPSLAQLVEHDVHGLRVAVDNPTELQLALESLSSSDVRRRRMGDMARALAVAEYGVDVVAAQHERLYRDAIAMHRVS